MPRGLRWKGGIPPEEREKFGVREAEPRGGNRSRNLARVSLLGGQRGILIVLPPLRQLEVVFAHERDLHRKKNVSLFLLSATSI